MPRKPKDTGVRFNAGYMSGFATSDTRIFNLRKMVSTAGTKSSRRRIRIWKR